MNKIKISLSGASGKMGQAILNILPKYSNIELVSTLNHIEDNQLTYDAFVKSDVVIDFSHSDNIRNLTKIAKSTDTKLVIGTTGFTAEHFQYINDAAEKNAILYSPNMSLGVNLISNLAEHSAKKLQDYDIEIIESHHRYKKDAPSGTALMLGKNIAKAKNIDFNKHAIFDRANQTDPRQKDQIGFSSIRAGGLLGEHHILFASENEVVTIKCHAISRSSYAEGAIYAAIWIIDKNNGLYSMKDCLL